MAPIPIPLIVWTDKGLYCPAGEFYIDPHRAVDTAIVTHAHSDHARRGMKKYICVDVGVGLLKARVGHKIQVQGIPFGKSFSIGKVQISFHSAGHILGSAQVRIQRGSEVWVVSGDYKREADPSCDPFEVVPCDTYITEATFGTPKYKWDKTKNHGQDIYKWWLKNANAGKNSLLFGYSLGKAQRILGELAPHMNRPVLIHAAIVELTECYRKEGRILAPTCEINEFLSQNKVQGELILAPPSILQTELVKHLGEYETAFASGWMNEAAYGSEYGRGAAYDFGFVMSDHADWNDLNQTIEETGAKEVYVLHRGNGALVRHLRKKGLRAHPISALTQNEVELGLWNSAP